MKYRSCPKNSFILTATLIAAWSRFNYEGAFVCPSNLLAYAFSLSKNHGRIHINDCCHQNTLAFSKLSPVTCARLPSPLTQSFDQRISSQRITTSNLFLAPFDIERTSSFISSQILSADIDSFLAASSNVISGIFDFSGNVPFIPSLILNSILFFSLRPKLMTMLTPSGFAHSLALGTMLWTTLGWRGWTVCVLYLFLGQLVTKVGFAEKEAMGIAEKRGGRRGPENVWGSALTGVLCASAAAQALKSGDPFIGLSSDVWILGYVASLATKLADTFASEIGKAYGKTTFLITSLQPVPRGTEGAVSLEGTLASVVGGLALALYAYFIVGLVPTLEGVGVATFAAFVATMVESLIGATLQDKEGLSWMTNEVVNFFNTLIGAAIAIFLGVFALNM